MSLTHPDTPVADARGAVAVPLQADGAPAVTRVITARRGTWVRLREVIRYHELLTGMVRKELKVKYRNSVLGFLWTMVNPALYLAVFWIVFTKFLPNGIPQFELYFLSGLLIWNLFSNTLGAACGSVVGAAGIVKKVYFPREILPLAHVGANLVHFFLQSIVLVIAFIGFQHQVDWGYLWMLPPTLLVLLLFTAGLGLFLAAANVYLRDTQHMLELILLAWFWMSPVVYTYVSVAARKGWYVGLWKLNPITWILLPFQRTLFNKTSYIPKGQTTPSALLPSNNAWWYMRGVGIVFLCSIALFFFAMWVFGRAEGNFAEEL